MSKSEIDRDAAIKKVMAAGYERKAAEEIVMEHGTGKILATPPDDDGKPKPKFVNLQNHLVQIYDPETKRRFQVLPWSEKGKEKDGVYLVEGDGYRIFLSPQGPLNMFPETVKPVAPVPSIPVAPRAKLPVAPVKPTPPATTQELGSNPPGPVGGDVPGAGQSVPVSTEIPDSQGDGAKDKDDGGTGTGEPVKSPGPKTQVATPSPRSRQARANRHQ